MSTCHNASGMGGGIQVIKTTAAATAKAAADATAAAAAAAARWEADAAAAANAAAKTPGEPSWEQVTAFTKSRLTSMGYMAYDSDMSTLDRGNGLKLAAEIVRWKMSGMVLGILMPGGDWSGSIYDPFKQVICDGCW